MSLLRSIVVDDEPLARELVEGYVNQTPFLESAGSYPDALSAMEAIRNGMQAELLFLDIQMPNLSGLELSRLLPPEMKVIFITAFEQYAVEGFRVEALDYLLKPVSYGAFCTKLSRAIQRVQRRKGGQVALQLSGGGMQLLDTGDILYLETRNRMLYYHTATQEYAVRGSLAGAEKQLAAYHFARCNQCYLVNLQYVRGVENDFVQVGDARLEISRRQKAAFMTAVASYLGGVL